MKVYSGKVVLDFMTLLYSVSAEPCGTCVHGGFKITN